METSQSSSSGVSRPDGSTSQLRQTTSLDSESETGLSRTSYLPIEAMTAFSEDRQRWVSTFSQFGFGHSACPNKGAAPSKIKAYTHDPRISSERTTVHIWVAPCLLSRMHQRLSTSSPSESPPPPKAPLSCTLPHSDAGHHRRDLSSACLCHRPSPKSSRDTQCYFGCNNP